MFLYYLAAFKNPDLLHIAQQTVTPTLSYRHRRYWFCGSILQTGETLCQLYPLCCLFSVLGLVQPLAFSLFLFFNNPVFSQFQVPWLLTSLSTSHFLTSFLLFSRIYFLVFLTIAVAKETTSTLVTSTARPGRQHLLSEIVYQVALPITDIL